MTESGYTLRAAATEDWDELNRVLGLAFNEELEDDATEVERAVWEPERTVLAHFGDELAGVAGAYTRDLTVPGGVIGSAHVTMVGVEPTYRRRGVLTGMMGRLFEDAQRLGEPVAHLWASEGKIYQRYGYGLAAQRLTFDAVREAQLRLPVTDPGGRLRSAVPGDVVADLQKVYEQVRADRPGWSSRDERWWQHTVADPKSWRDGATSLRALVHEGPGGVDGYALYRIKNDWQSGGTNAVQVREAVAGNPGAYQAIWHFLLNVDLTRRAAYRMAAIDEPLLYLINEPNLLNAKQQESLWLRLVDVPAALAARRYAAPVDVVLEVEDPVIGSNTGRWHLTGDPGTASCTRTDRPADLWCDLAALGAAYLGGAALATLAAAGRVRELVPGTLERASTGFGWHRAPSATEVF